MNKITAPISNAVYSNIFAIGIITASLAPSPAWAQATTEFSAYCLQDISDERRTVVTDRFTVTGQAGDEFNVRQSITQKFKEATGHVGNASCSINESAVELERDRNFIIGYAAKMYAVTELKGWHPNKTDAVKLSENTGASAPTKIQTPEPSAKRDSIIVRQPDEAPVKPAAKPAPKPAAKAKPAAKPIPKKSLSKCGGKGQRRCKVKSM